MVGRKMSMSRNRSMRRSRGMSMGRSRGMRRSMRMARSRGMSRGMRGGNITGDGRTYITSSSDGSDYLVGQSPSGIQEVNRDNSPLSGEGPMVNYNQLLPPLGPGVIKGGRLSRRGGRRSMRRMRRMRGGAADCLSMAQNPDNVTLDETVKPGPVFEQPATVGGMYDNNSNADLSPMTGGRRRRNRKRQGGGIIATAALPFGLYGLQKWFQGRRSSEPLGRVTRKMRRTLKM